jgi:hypothetical protein
VVTSAGQAIPRPVRLGGSGGIVDAIVVSVLKGNLDPRPACSASDCCELNDDAALEVLEMAACSCCADIRCKCFIDLLASA